MEELVLQAFYNGGLECCLPEEEGLLDESSSNIDDVEWRGIHDEVRMCCGLSIFFILFNLSLGSSVAVVVVIL